MNKPRQVYLHRLVSQFTFLECRQASSPRTCLDWFLKCSHLGPVASCVRALWRPWSHRCLSKEKNQKLSVARRCLQITSIITTSLTFGTSISFYVANVSRLRGDLPQPCLKSSMSARSSAKAPSTQKRLPIFLETTHRLPRF